LRAHRCRVAIHLCRGAGVGADAALKIDSADTAWMISATGLVLMMTIPGLALFYCGMVRKKNVLATMAQSFACTGLCSLLWFVVGYSLSFAGDGAWLGTFERAVPARYRPWIRSARLRRPSRNSCLSSIR
jgi:hypothetical protein